MFNNSRNPDITWSYFFPNNNYIMNLIVHDFWLVVIYVLCCKDFDSAQH